MSKKVISIVLCLALVVAMAVPAFATSTTLYTRTNSGYRISGTATISGTSASSTMTATAITSTPSHPITDYSGTVAISCYAAGNTYLGSSDTYGSPTLYTSFNSSKGSIVRIDAKHTFNGIVFYDGSMYA